MHVATAIRGDQSEATDQRRSITKATSENTIPALPRCAYLGDASVLAQPQKLRQVDEPVAVAVEVADDREVSTLLPLVVSGHFGFQYALGVVDELAYL